MFNRPAQTVTVQGISFEVNAAGQPVEPCPRCLGTGRYSFDGQTDACYGCAALGRDPWHVAADGTQAGMVKVLKRRAADRARRDKAAARKMAAAMAKADAVQAANEALLVTDPLAADATYQGNMLAAVEEYSPAWYRMARMLKGYDYVASNLRTRSFTANTVQWAGEATARIIAQAAQDAAAVPAPQGRVTVEGVVLSTKAEEVAGYGYGRTTSMSYKMLVKADAGWKVWSTIPAALFDQVDGPLTGEDSALKGRRVEFTATLVRSDDDPAFAIGTRPTKARMLAGWPGCAYVGKSIPAPHMC